MIPFESREAFIDALFAESDLQYLKEAGLYDSYVQGDISIETIYKQLRDQGI